MAKDYYQTLGLTREASKSDICRAYKKKALVWHPKLSKEDPTTALHNFCEISEAFEVLFDDHKRAFYDKYGEALLKEGFFSDGELKGGYHFKGNPEEIFENFFGTHNIYSALLEHDSDNMGSMLGFSFGSQNYKETRKPTDLVVEVPCTLAELYSGCSKQVSFDRTTLNRDGVTTSLENCHKTFEVKPGMKDGEEVTFSREGHQQVGVVPSNLIFKVKQEGHSDYRRKNNDLIYTAKITLLAALCSDPVRVKTLDGRTLSVGMSEVISQDTVKKVEGEGLLDNSTGQRGDLYISFKIIFPTQLSDAQRQTLRQTLS